MIDWSIRRVEWRTSDKEHRLTTTRAPHSNRAVFLSALCTLFMATAGHAQFRVASYNIANSNGDPSDLQAVFEELALDDTPGAATAPHLYVFQEARESDIDDIESILNAAHPGLGYVRGTYTSNNSEDGSVGAQALFYRSDLVTELTAGHDDISTGASRNTDRWRLRLANYQFDFYLYSSHLKAGQGQENEDDRADGAEAIRSNADALPSDAHVIYVGDYNFYSPNEPGYQALIAPGAKQANDPLGNGSWSGTSNAIKHTQSPRASNGGGLVGGGMDDRFDQHLVSEGLLDDSGFALVDYRAFGNDGNHYNTSINSGNNSYYPGQTSRSNALADALFGASDHIPVVVDYQYPGLVSGLIQDELGTVIQGAGVYVDVLLSNIAPGDPAFIASCPVYVEAGLGFFGDDSVADVAKFPNFDTVTLLLDTTTVGDLSGTVQVSGLGEDMNAPLVLSSNATIVGHARPSFSDLTELDGLELAYELDATDPEFAISLPVFNFDHSGLQARCSVDSITGLGEGLVLESLPSGLIGAIPGAIELSFDPATEGAGTYAYSLQVEVMDEDLPGAQSSQLTIELVIEVDDPSGSPADFNGDGVVDGVDLTTLLGSWGSSLNDITGDGIVSGPDLAFLLGSWGVVGG